MSYQSINLGVVPNDGLGDSPRSAGSKINANFQELYSRALSAGTTFANSGTIVFSNSNGVSFGLSGNTLTASAIGGVGGVGISAGTTQITSGTLIFSNSNGVSFGLNGSTITASANGGGVGISAGTTQITNGTAIFSNSNGVSFGMDNGTVTASHNGLTSQSNQAFSAQGGSSAFQTLVFVNTQGISFSNSNGSVYASVQTNYLTTAAQSNQIVNSINGATGIFSFATGSSLSSSVNGNSITWGLASNITTALQSTGAYLTTAAQSNQVINSINGSTGIFSFNTGSSLSSSRNGNSITWGLASNITTALQSTGAYLTTAAQSNQVINSINGQTGLFSFATGSSLSSSVVGNSITWGLASNITTALQSTGAYLTTADLSANSSNYFRNWKLTGNTSGTTSSAQGTDLWLAGGNGVTISGSSNSISFSVATSYRASNDAIGLNTAKTNVTWTVNSSGLSLDAGGYAGTGTTFAGTNISASITFNSVGLNMALSAGGAGGTTNQTGPNIAAGSQTGTSGTIVFSNSNNISFGMSNSSIVTASYNYNVSVAGSSNNINSVVYSNSNGLSFGLNGSTITADARNILSTYEPFAAVGLSTVLVGVPTNTSAGVSVYPFVIEEYVSAGIMNLAFSMAFLTVGTSSGRQTMGLAVGLYTRNVSTLSSLVSTSFSLGVTGNNSSYTINQPNSTAYSAYGANADTNSAGSNISSGYTGMKLVGFPINSLLSPGNYWLAMIGTNSTSSINVGISMSHIGAAMGTFGSALAPIGSFSSAFTAGQDPRGGRWNVGQGSWTSAGSVTNLPASMNLTSISAIGQTYPIIKFWST